MDGSPGLRPLSLFPRTQAFYFRPLSGGPSQLQSRWHSVRVAVRPGYGIQGILLKGSGTLHANEATGLEAPMLSGVEIETIPDISGTVSSLKRQGCPLTSESMFWSYPCS